MQDFSLSFFIVVNTNKKNIIKIVKTRKDFCMKVYEHNQKIIIGRNKDKIEKNEDYEQKHKGKKNKIMCKSDILAVLEK